MLLLLVAKQRPQALLCATKDSSSVPQERVVITNVKLIARVMLILEEVVCNKFNIRCCL